MWVQLLLIALGVIAVLVGVAMINVPAAVILLGLALGATGFFWDDLTRPAA